MFRVPVGSAAGRGRLAYRRLHRTVTHGSWLASRGRVSIMPTTAESWAAIDVGCSLSAVVARSVRRAGRRFTCSTEPAS